MTVFAAGPDRHCATATSSIDRAIRLSTAAAVLTVAVIAAYVSYWHAYAVVRAHGETGITARLEPATIQVGDGSSVLVEEDEDTYGVEEVSRASDGVLNAGQRLESALGSVRDAAQAALDAMSKLSPETVEVEFGIKLAGEAGALIAKASAEGHFTVRLTWSPGKKP